MKNRLIFKAVISSLLVGTPVAVFAQDMEANANAYADNESGIDSMNATYQSYFGVTSSTGSDDTVYDMSFNNGGNVYQDKSSTSTAINYTDTTAAQKIGYASNLCATQVAYNTLKAKGVALSADQEARYERVRDRELVAVLVDGAAAVRAVPDLARCGAVDHDGVPREGHSIKRAVGAVEVDRPAAMVARGS